MTKKIDPVNKTDDEAKALVQKLVSENRYAGLGVKEEGSGIPLVSRIAFAYDESCGLFFAASDLSIHSRCLLKCDDCSLLIGEPGKGDGLAHPRVTIVGKASRMPNDWARSVQCREAFLEAHPKAELYIDFADFGFYPVMVERAYLNGGFGKAYHLEKGDLAFLQAV